MEELEIKSMAMESESIPEIDHQSPQLINNLPKCRQKPRSPAPNRRTDFSTFFNHESLHVCSAGRDGMSTATTSTSDFWDNGEIKLKDLRKLLSYKIRKKVLDVSNAVPISRHAPLESSPDGSYQHDQLSDKMASSISSRTEGDFVEKRKSKRDRKRKLHSDEVTCQPKSENKNLRRYKIMRSLGLAPPLGSLYARTVNRYCKVLLKF